MLEQLLGLTDKENCYCFALSQCTWFTLDGSKYLTGIKRWFLPSSEPEKAFFKLNQSCGCAGQWWQDPFGPVILQVTLTQSRMVQLRVGMSLCQRRVLGVQETESRSLVASSSGEDLCSAEQVSGRTALPSFPFYRSYMPPAQHVKAGDPIQ